MVEEPGTAEMGAAFAEPRNVRARKSLNEESRKVPCVPWGASSEVYGKIEDAGQRALVSRDPASQGGAGSRTVTHGRGGCGGGLGRKVAEGGGARNF